MKGETYEKAGDDTDIDFFMSPDILSAAEPQEALIVKARSEGKVTFYANITAVEPVVEAFTKKYGWVNKKNGENLPHSNMKNRQIADNTL